MAFIQSPPYSLVLSVWFFRPTLNLYVSTYYNQPFPQRGHTAFRAPCGLYIETPA